MLLLNANIFLQDFSSEHSGASLPSIFYEASVIITRDQNHFYVINHGGNSGVALPHTAASFLLSTTGEAYFALAHSNNSRILLIIMGSKDTLGKFSQLFKCFIVVYMLQ